MAFVLTRIEIWIDGSPGSQGSVRQFTATYEAAGKKQRQTCLPRGVTPLGDGDQNTRVIPTNSQFERLPQLLAAFRCLTRYCCPLNWETLNSLVRQLTYDPITSEPSFGLEPLFTKDPTANTANSLVSHTELLENLVRRTTKHRKVAKSKPRGSAEKGKHVWFEISLPNGWDHNVPEEKAIQMVADCIHFYFWDPVKLDHRRAQTADLIRWLHAAGVRWGDFFEAFQRRISRDAYEWTVDLMELGPYLRKYRETIGLSFARMMPHFIRLQTKAQGLAWFPSSKAEIEKLESGGVKKLVSLQRLSVLAELYAPDGVTIGSDMPQLMIEWLASKKEPIHEQIVVHGFDEFREPAKGTHIGAVHCTYKTAPERLQGFECAIVHLELDSYRGTKTPDIMSQAQIDAHVCKNVPHTLAHQHPGDEMIVCLEGTVVAELGNNGTRARLHQNDYIHFNSDVPHSVWNLKEVPASLLILRFFHLHREGTRHLQKRMIKELRKHVRALENQDQKSVPSAEVPTEDEARTIDGGNATRKTGVHGRHLILGTGLLETAIGNLWEILDRWRSFRLAWFLLESWLHDRERAPLDRLHQHSERNEYVVRDRVGLCAFLNRLILTEGQCKKNHAEFGNWDNLTALLRKREAGEPLKLPAIRRLKDLWRELAHYIAKTHAPKSGREDMEREINNCLSAEPPPVLEQMSSLEDSTDDAPIGLQALDLLAKFFGIPPVLLECYAAPPVLGSVVVRDRGDEWITLPPSDGVGSQGVSLNYSIPCRNLANSDVSIHRLRLKPGSRTDWNWHPGFEVLVPLGGSVRVEHQHRPNDDIYCKTGQYIVYRSDQSHRVNHHGKELADVLVIRFSAIDVARQTVGSDAPSNMPGRPN